MANNRCQYPLRDGFRDLSLIGEPPRSLVVAVLSGVLLEGERGERDDRDDQCGDTELGRPLEIHPHDKGHGAIAKESKAVQSTADAHSPLAEVEDVTGEHSEQQ